MINAKTLEFLETRLSASEITEIVHLAKKTHRIERQYVNKIDELWDYLFEISFDQVRHGNVPDIERAFTSLFMEHYLDTTEAAVDSVKKSKLTQLARTPKSLRDLMKAWDLWRNKKQPTKYKKKQAEQIKKAYLDKLQKTWGKYREDWESGDVDKDEIKRKIKKEAETTKARANTIIETETTKYWNQTRVDMYKDATFVTHYLYLPIRDMATTPWCYPGVRQHDRVNRSGLRGRGLLVYSKDDREIEKICPSHWNCRSELVPLTPANTRHKKMIDDKTMARRNHKCVPLPQDWG